MRRDRLTGCNILRTISLHFGPSRRDEIPTLIGISNTDKSVRVYDSQGGAFMDREWGHTESINGVTLVDSGEATRKVVNVGCDGTIMIRALDLRTPELRAGSRSSSPVGGSSRPVLRRVLSKAELAEFPRPSSSGGRRPPRNFRLLLVHPVLGQTIRHPAGLHPVDLANAPLQIARQQHVWLEDHLFRL